MNSSEDMEYSNVSKSEESELMCSCGLPAKLRTSKTSRNPYRLFYNCLKSPDKQCGFFQWCDEPLKTGDKHVDELNLIRSECIRLQERIDDIQQERDSERTDWNRERTELTSELSTVKAELDKIKLVNESDLLPPLDNISKQDEVGDALVVQTL
ncbi:hypothetical protein Vadar_004966 [Vaccinium darrowii]|uniref:Uncharacterized protein n=1 Tax=Vaccinium darrowii TaxID=229202 RepID=A0ACB7WXW3_9ERIC|nr:hypothetical protein Vadar_004966 [Vaccinium darrowii]